MNNAKFALIVAEKIRLPPYEHIEFASYHKFLEEVRYHTPPLLGVEPLSENVWQIRLTDGLYALSEILREAKTRQIPVRVLFFENEPQWLNQPPSDLNKQAQKPE